MKYDIYCMGILLNYSPEEHFKMAFASSSLYKRHQFQRVLNYMCASLIT